MGLQVDGNNSDPVSSASSYDIAIIGGGLAGLALSIQSAVAGHSVILFEKEKYPFHKVCGEYISLESWSFLESLGVPLSSMHLPLIKKLVVSAPSGKSLNHNLPLGGFGISRFTLDAALARIARQKGVVICEETKVMDVSYSNDRFAILTQNSAFTAKIAAGTYGKRGNLDVKWKRSFIQKKPGKLDNYIGIKYHVRATREGSTIELHNFQTGYCGISKIEDDKHCLCYLTAAANLSNNGNSIELLEENVLYRNPHLKEIFSSSEKLNRSPLVISQVSFSKKTQVEEHVLMIGDAAGMITPLCGNGMSMALHGSKLAFEVISHFLGSGMSRGEMELRYKAKWSSLFKNRLRTGRIIQGFFGNATLSNLLVSSLKPFPRIVDSIVKATHGKPF